ncbi:MAG TPA: hypothetical protein VK348_01195 [Planctomycetota bacterium]|nr:hypothetical protein [Planctomycetota bacterium]
MAVPSCALFAGVCAATLAAQQPKEELEDRIQHALAEARSALLVHLRSATEAVGAPGELALLVLAALHDGVRDDDKTFAKARRRLADAKPEATYDLALRLLVLEADATFPGRDKLAAGDTRQLLQNAKAGAFFYMPNPTAWDLSNSQYGALGLRAAVALGQDVPHRVWSALADTAMEAQRPDGGFVYRATDDPRSGYLSMTTAGIAVLKICEQALTKPGRTIPEIDKRVAKAWKWLDKHATEIGKSEIPWSYYAHYGLERAAILSDVQTIGGVDWYRAGAKMFVDQQLGNGGWSSPTDRMLGHGAGAGVAAGNGSPVSTAFAILFLRRKFQKLPTPITGISVPFLGMLTAETPDKDVTACGQALAARGKDALLEILNALRNDLPTRRRAAAIALHGLAGQDFGFDPLLDEAGNRSAIHRAELWYLKNK